MIKTIITYFRGRKVYRELKGIASLIFNELYLVVKESIEEFEKRIYGYGNEDILSSKKNGLLTTESIFYVFWFFLKNNQFNLQYKKILLDEIHNKLYKTLKAQGITKNELTFLVQKINLIYNDYRTTSSENEEKKLFLNKIIEVENNISPFIGDDNELYDDDLIRKGYLKTYSEILYKNIDYKIEEINQNRKNFLTRSK